MEKQRFWLYRRAGVYYLQDAVTRKRESLMTRNRRKAEQIRLARSEAVDHPGVGIALAKAYLAAQDPQLPNRTWQQVIDEFCSRGKPQTCARRRRATNRAPINQLAQRKLIETTADDFMKVLREGGAMANATLHCLQNLAVGFGWLPTPVLPPKLWPVIRVKKKRGIIWAEHCHIVEAERNLERRLYYELLWETGASQADAACLGQRGRTTLTRLTSPYNRAGYYRAVI